MVNRETMSDFDVDMNMLLERRPNPGLTHTPGRILRKHVLWTVLEVRTAGRVAGGRGDVLEGWRVCEGGLLLVPDHRHGQEFPLARAGSVASVFVRIAVLA
jgi:hypothetical protein